jgi:hypothetical protein
VEPSWEDSNEADNDSHPFSIKFTVEGDKFSIKHLSNKKSTKVAINATVAKQLCKDLLVDPHSYDDFDHNPPITQLHLNFLLSSNNTSAVQPPRLPEDAADHILDAIVAEENINMEPIVNDNKDKSFFDKGDGKFSAVE